MHVRVVLPEPWMLDGLIEHEMPEGALTASPTGDVKPESPVIVMVVEPEVPAARIIDPMGPMEKSGRVEERQMLLSVIPIANMAWLFPNTALVVVKLYAASTKSPDF